MANIFRCQDDDGDRLTVRTSVNNPDSVLFDAESGDAVVTVRVYREQVLELHNALGELLYPTGTPLPDMTEHFRAVTKAMKGLATAVQSMHLTPVATVKMPAPEPLCNHLRPADAHAASRCTWCGHLWTEHAGSTTRTRCGQCGAYNDLSTPHVCEPEPQHHGRLMSELPRRVRKCISCAHAVIDHIPPARNWDGGCLECPCNWMGPTR